MALDALNKICKVINKRLNIKKTISDEQMFKYLQEIYSMSKNNEDVPEEFLKLRKNMMDDWNYGHAYDSITQDAFMKGVIFAGIMLSNIKRDEEEAGPKLIKAIKDVEPYINILKTIKENPGIKHNKLAELVKKSTVELSQIMGLSVLQTCYSAAKVGREKYYYIEQYGEKILENIK